ncbi:SGNH/GDSL hydrolase family protein [Acetonema longum]|uniref:Phosphatase n=1 Tax=Acetonema longum DSM 6540 TaxID=1009370 RepID=F7NDI7_9FIRM|nr:SGNH/GDSL hydrolase family protein [Acetonema longum]EGO65849.1 phosphatase [Acetonema longum DSM 6540]
MKIVALGDSITYGFPYLPEFSWVRLVSDELDIAMLNKGMNGDTTWGMLERFALDVISRQPSHVIILGGANDAFEGVIPNEVLDNVGKMARMAGESGIVPWIGLPTPCSNFAEEALLGQYRQLLRRYTAANGIGLIDFYSAMLNPAGDGIREGLYFDGVHPNEAGYRVMAGVASDFLRRCVKQA